MYDLFDPFSDVFRDFFNEHAAAFIDAPQTISGEQNMEYYSLFQRYLKLYENQLLDYIESLNVSMEEFYRELAEVSNDPEIKDKKLLHFVNYLIACTDYESFYKVMTRAAKKLRKNEALAESKGGESKSSSAADSKGYAGESKSDHK